MRAHRGLHVFDQLAEARIAMHLVAEFPYEDRFEQYAPRALFA